MEISRSHSSSSEGKVKEGWWMSVEKSITAQHVKDDVLLESGFDLQRKQVGRYLQRVGGARKVVRVTALASRIGCFGPLMTQMTVNTILCCPFYGLHLANEGDERRRGRRRSLGII